MKLQNENKNHKTAIASNKERKAFLEDRAKTSETRLEKIEESLDYSLETKDKEIKKRLEASRSELMNVIWILTNE